MPPILALVGRGNSGKTTLLFKIVSELTRKNYKIATIKHTFHSIVFDKPGTDSWKHIKAGSTVTVLSTPDAVFMIKPETKNGDLTRIIELLGEDHDLIIVEGYKKSDIPKIEVHRNATGPLLTGIKNLIAVATDEPLNINIQQFSLNDVAVITEFIISNFIRPYKHNYSIYINHQPVESANMNSKTLEKLLSLLINDKKRINSKEIRDFKLFYKK